MQISSVIATNVDPKFYTVISQSTTSFVGSDPGALSTVSPAINGQPATAMNARIGVHTATVNGKTEYSLFIAPSLADEIQEILESESVQKRTDLEERAGPILAIGSLYSLFGSEVAIAFASSFSGVGLAAAAAAVVPVGATLAAGGLIAAYLAERYILAKTSDRHYIGAFPAAITITLNDIKDVNSCPKTRVKCSTCSGSRFLCTTGVNDKCTSFPITSHCVTHAFSLMQKRSLRLCFGCVVRQVRMRTNHR
jgi:hypothetical protein